MPFREHIRSQLVSSHSEVSGALDERPPLSIQKSLVVDPVRNRLLADSGPTSSTNASCEAGLAPGVLDGALQRGNVRFLHEHRAYTRQIVNVNKAVCFSEHQEVCKVLHMNTAQKKAVPPALRKPQRKRKEKPQPVVGPDGLTLSRHVRLLMTERGIGQTELARMCSEYYATFVPGAEDVVKQQHIFNLLAGQSSVDYLPLLAAVFDVNEMWLQFGIGKRDRA